jgi:hypothetical protein
MRELNRAFVVQLADSPSRLLWPAGCNENGQDATMRGFITEQHFEQAETEFPGIRRLYQSCDEKERPRTFLDLVMYYLRVMDVMDVEEMTAAAH